MISAKGQNLAFILSTPRAGSTLLGALLANNQGILCPPEPWLLLPLNSVRSHHAVVVSRYDHEAALRAWSQYCDDDLWLDACRSLCSSVYNRFLARHDCDIFVDKTPRYYGILPWLDSLFPDAVKIWLKRNPLDVFASVIDTWGVPIDELTGKQLSLNSFDTTVSFSFLDDFFKKDDCKKITIAYEKLATFPEHEIRRVLDLLKVPCENISTEFGTNEFVMRSIRNAEMGDKKILKHIAPHASSIDKWKSSFEPEQVQKILETLGRDIFDRLDYQKAFKEACEFIGTDCENISAKGEMEKLVFRYENFFAESPATSPHAERVLLKKNNESLKKSLKRCERESEDRLEVIRRQGSELKKAEGRLNHTENLLRQSKSHVLHLQKDLDERLNVIRGQGDRLEMLKGTRNDLENQMVRLKSQMQERMAVILRQGDELARLKGMNNDLENQMVRLKSQMQERMAVIFSQGDELGRLQGMNNDLQNRMRQLQSQKCQAERELQERLDVIQRKGDEIGRLQGQINQAQKQLEDRLAVIRRQGDELGRLGGLKNDLALQLEHLKATKEQAYRHLDERMEVIRKQGTKIGRLEGELARQKALIDKNRHAIRCLELWQQRIIDQFGDLSRTHGIRMLKILKKWRDFEDAVMQSPFS